MDMIAACVVAGNVRRSALLSLGSPVDPEFANMKNYKDFPYETSQWRWASNNSINAEVGKTDYSAIAESIALNGEPGVVWMDNVRKYSRNRDNIYFVDKNAKGTNPCFTPKTLIHTRSGHFPIESLVGKSVEIWDGNSWILIDNFRITGQYQDMIEVELQDGSLIKTTLYHEYILENGLRVEGRNLKVGDKLSFSEAPLTHGIHKEPGAYLKGFLVGDGTTDGKKPILWLYEPKYMCEDRLIKSASEVELTKSRSDSIIDGRFDVVKSNKKEKKINRKIMQGLSVRKDELIRWCNEYKKNLPLSIFEWDEESKLNFIAGVLDSDGTASDTKNGWLYQVSSINEKWLMDFQLLLKTIGVNSKLSLMRKAGKTDFHDGYGEYKTKDCFRLTIAQCSSIVLAQKVIFSRLVSFAEKETIYKLRNKMNKIVNIRFAGVDEKVYCCTVPTNNTISLTCGIKTGQCSEQTLESYELCCLVETFPSRHDSYEEYKETLKYAYLYAKTVTLVPTEWQETNAVMLKNRRIGVSQSGIIDAFNRHGRRNMLRWCDQGYQVIKEYDEQYSNWFCVPRSIKVTSVKPSGTVSLLPGVSPGIHYPHSEFYIRRIRVASDNPLVDILKKAGYHTQFEAVGSEDERKKTTVVDFPIHEKNFSKKKDDVSIWEQVKNVVDYQNWWADNQVSVTVTFKKSEAKSIKDVLEMYEDQLKSISFLPISEHGYPLAPYEEISGDRYLEMLNKITKPDYSSITASAEGAKFCDSDHCEV
jgi:intein-encoded DNA endonuclease-like protein